MRRAIHLILPALGALALIAATPACGEKAPPTAPEADKPEADKPEADKPEADKPEADKPEADKPEADEAKGEFIRFDVNHHDPDRGMVHGHFEKFRVTSAHVDLDNLDRAHATIEIDLASVKTGNEKRDDHVRSADFFEVATYATATVNVKNVKAGEGGTYSADAEVSLHGVSRTLPVTFKVVETHDDGSITIEGEHRGLARADFNIGGSPEDTNVAPNLEFVKVRLKLANTP